MNELSDDQILGEFKGLCEEYHIGSSHALGLLKQIFDTYKAGIDLSIIGERATNIEEFEISEVPPLEWPDWAQALVPSESRFEHHTFQNGRTVARLHNPRHLLLLAQELESDS